MPHPTTLQRLADYIGSSYGDLPEFLWEDFDAAVWRNQRNRKWYGIVQKVNGAKLGITCTPTAAKTTSTANDATTATAPSPTRAPTTIPILNVRLTPEEVAALCDGERFFPGYHMNKRYWLTIRLDGVVDFATITKLIDASYQIIDRKS